MPHPSRREDLSRFLVHLTRDSHESSARENLVSILRDKTIEARNSHCLFKHDILKLGFSEVLAKRFKTVRFTETPLMHIHRLTGKIPGRSVELTGYGLVFAKDALIERGACPAIYLNAKGTRLREYLLDRFRSDFGTIKSLAKLKQEQASHYASIIRYYSLINIIASNYDFTWEREWRYSDSFEFKYRDIFAIVAQQPTSFESYCKRQLPAMRNYIDRIPIVSPDWSYEEVVETMSIKIWGMTRSRTDAQ
jgi:hypothetical protein